ncbi:helix-turn-helix domain-containing protein [Streptomyces phaeochromogenes]|uniref:helix-turn-helix domain-containing protein n=1 Tax=Streptomyces phaeochromogenes TaxID=1923 RepID=UPI0036B1706D
MGEIEDSGSVEATEKSERPRRANDLGPSGVRLAKNLKTLRLSLPLTTEQLAMRVSAYGRPMRANTITKIEKEQRRVDVDDLVALALALETRPDALLLPPTIAMDNLELVEGKTVTAFSAWRWANGDQPLDVPEGDDGTAHNAFQMRAQPLGLRGYRKTPEQIEAAFQAEPEGDSRGEHPETPER